MEPDVRSARRARRFRRGGVLLHVARAEIEHAPRSRTAGFARREANCSVLEAQPPNTATEARSPRLTIRTPLSARQQSPRAALPSCSYQPNRVDSDEPRSEAAARVAPLGRFARLRPTHWRGQRDADLLRRSLPRPCQSAKRISGSAEGGHARRAKRGGRTKQASWLVLPGQSDCPRGQSGTQRDRTSAAPRLQA